MNKLKQQLRQELIAKKNFCQDFHDGSNVNEIRSTYAYRKVQFIDL